MRLRSTAVSASFGKRKITIATWRLLRLGVMGLAAGIAAVDAVGQAAPAQAITNINARGVALHIPGASAISQVGTFLNDPAACAHPIPTKFPSYTQPGAVLDPNRILVGSRSNFGAPLAGVGQAGSFLSI